MNETDQSRTDSGPRFGTGQKIGSVPNVGTELNRTGGLGSEPVPSVRSFGTVTSLFMDGKEFIKLPIIDFKTS